MPKGAGCYRFTMCMADTRPSSSSPCVFNLGGMCWKLTALLWLCRKGEAPAPPARGSWEGQEGGSAAGEHVTYLAAFLWADLPELP